MISIAKKILGKKNVFGLDEWKKYFGEKVHLDVVPEIPWGKEVLSNPEIYTEGVYQKQEHFLFLGVELLEGKPLNLLALRKLFSGKSHPKFYNGEEHYWYEFQEFAKKACAPRWFFMPVGIAKHSLNLSYFDQSLEELEVLPDEYEAASAPERLTANILYFLLNNCYLDKVYWARTDTYAYHHVFGGEAGGRVCVLGHNEQGLRVVVGETDTKSSTNTGVSASRRIASVLEIERIRSDRKREKAEREEDARMRYLTRDN